MARQLLVLALVFVAIVGLVSAQSPASAPTASSPAAPGRDSSTVVPGPDAEGNVNDDYVPTEGAGPEGAALEGSIGGPVPIEAFGPDVANANLVPAEPPKSGATALEVSAIAAGAAVAGFFF